MVEKSNSKENERFKSQLSSVNTLFERAREWADLSNCLQKVKKVIDQNPGLPVPNKRELAKRLQQCLNPDLNVIHQLTLEVYAWIFAREISLMPSDHEDQAVVWGQGLGLFYSGLFNFYQFAAFEVKRQFLKIIQEYVLKLKRELLLSLPGFLLCMLPALEDQNSDLLKQVEAILTETEKIVGTTKFFGETWKAMLRTPRCRLSATKFLDRRIPRTPQAASKLIRDGKVYLSPYHYEIRAGKVTLADYSSQTLAEWYLNEKVMLETLLSSESTESYFFFYYPNKQKLVNNALLAGLSIEGQDVYVNRAVFDFLISHMPITSRINSEEEAINIVEGALLTLVRKDFASLKKFHNWFQGHFEETTDLIPISEDPAIRYVIPALKRIFAKFLNVKTDQKVVINQMGIQERSLWTLNTPIQIMINLLSDNTAIMEPILSKISVDLLNYIRHFYKDDLDSQTLEKFNTYVVNLFQMITGELGWGWMALGSLLSQEISQIDDDQYKIVSIDLITFVLKDLQPAVADQGQDLSQTIQFQNEELCKMLAAIVSGLLKGIEEISESRANQQFASPALDLIELILRKIESLSSQVDLQFQDSVAAFNTFYVNLSHSSVEQSKYATFKRCSQVLFRIQKYARSVNADDTLPEWLLTVIEKSSCRRRDSPSRVILVSIEAFLSIIEYNSADQNLRTIQALVLPRDHLQTSNNYCMDIIKTLWSLLDEAEDLEKIVQLLKKFDKYLPKIFSDVVTQDLSSKNREVKQNAVKKFSIFWKLTTSDFPEYKPFQPVRERMRDQSTSNEVRLCQQHLPYQEDNQADCERSYVALHNMLNILEDQDPTMRLSCRSWLSESKSAFLRILDPLLAEFIDNNKVFVSFTGQLFFMEGYDTQIIIENFGKLRNIILNTQDEMIKYIVTTKLSSYVESLFEQDHRFSKKSKIELIHCEGKYIQAIVYITLQFIMGQAVESLNQQLYQESQTVNASAAEFMELILKSVEPYKELAQEVSHIIVMPVIRTLRQSINAANEAQQVHLLNLLKVILFECNFFSLQAARRGENQPYVQNAKEIFSDELLLKCICDGMNQELSYVRNAFIEFSIKLVPFMRDVIDAKVMSKHSITLLDRYCKLLLQSDVQTETRDMRRAKFIINQENDIIAVVNGLKSIMNNCLGIIDEFENVEDAIEDQLKNLGKQNTQDTKGQGWFNWWGTKQETGPTDPNQLINNSIFLQMQNIILSCLNIWGDLDLYRVRDFHFTRMGVFPYHKEDDKRMDHLIMGKIPADLNVTKQKSDPRILSQKTQQQPSAATLTIDQDTFIRQNLNLIQTSIVSLLEPICAKYSFQLIKGFLEIWKTSSSLSRIGINVNQGCEKIIQILVSLQMDPSEVVEAVNKWIQSKKYDVQREKKSVDLTQEHKEKATLQSLICQFVYVYLLHTVHSSFKMVRNLQQTAEIRQAAQQEAYTRLFQSMARFMKAFVNTKNPNTVTWLIEMLYMLTNKFRPDDSKLEKRLKTELAEVFDLLLRGAASIITDSFGVKYSDQYGVDQICFSPTAYEMIKRYQFIKQKGEASQIERTTGQLMQKQNPYLVFSHSQLDLYTELPFQRDSIFTKMEQLRSYEQQTSDHEMALFMRRLNATLLESAKVSPMLQQEFYKFFTIVTLRQVLVRLTMSVFSAEETDKINMSLQLIVSAVIKILDNHVKQISKIDDAESKRQSQVQSEIMTDFLAGLTTENQILQKMYRQEITGMFNSDNFFLLSERTLRKWQQIMRNFMSVNNEMFEELLLKFNRVEGIFTTKKWEIQQKSLTFKRLAFLVYSNQTSTFEDQQLDTLLKKMTEGFKNTSKDREFTIQLFLLSRILMLRLSANSLAEVLRKLWPHLLNELVNVFDSSQQNPQSERDYLLQIEGMKVVELMSQLNIEDFHMNQWMFLFDGYGLSKQPNDQFGQPEVFSDKDVFQPFLVKFMCSPSHVQADENDQSGAMYSFYKVLSPEEFKDIPYRPKASQGPNPHQQRKTVFSGQTANAEDRVSLEKEAFRYAQELQQLLVGANIERTEIDRESAEALIEKDFLSKPRYFE